MLYNILLVPFISLWYIANEKTIIVGQWVFWTIDPMTQSIILKIVGFLKPPLSNSEYCNLLIFSLTPKFYNSIFQDSWISFRSLNFCQACYCFQKLVGVVVFESNISLCSLIVDPITKIWVCITYLQIRRVTESCPCFRQQLLYFGTLLN